MADIPAPEEPLDPDLLKPLGGAEPMGPPLDDAEIMPLELAVPRGDPADRDSFNFDAAVGGYAQRRDAALELLERTRDLRLYVRLAEALAWTDGPKAFHGALAGLAHMVKGHWAEIHPGPADDPSAQSLRVRAFTPLRNRLLANAFEPAVVFDAKERDGEITLRMIYHAAGRHDLSRLRRPASGETVYPADGMHGLVARAGAGGELAAMRDAMLGGAAALRALQAFFADTEGFDTLRFAGDGRRRGLIDELDDFAAALDAFVPEDAPAASAEPAGEGEAPAEGAAAAAAPAAPLPPTDLPTRADALALLDDVLRYFARSARSSPIALALIKIREMERATFYQWLEETVQEGRDWAQLPIWNADASLLDRFADDDGGEGAGGEGETAAAPAGRAGHLSALEETSHQLRSLMWDVDSLAAAFARAKEDLESHAAALAEAREKLAAGEEVQLPEAPEPPSAPSLDPAVFREIADRVQAAQEALAAEPAAAPSPAAGGAPSGRVADRNGVRAALLALGRHWRATEPSSPAAIALEKLAEMVDLAFIDIVRQVAADDVSRPALRLARNPTRE